MMEWRANLEPGEEACPDCGSESLMDDGCTGDTVCRDCGLVLSHRNIDPGKEWRAFTAEEESSRARTGLPVSRLLYDKGLPTRIGYLRGGTPAQKEKSRRLYKTNSRSRGDNVERNLRTAFDKIKMICGKLGIGDPARERSSLLYRKAVEKKLSRGRPMKSLVCAALFVGCKKNGTPRALEDFYRYCDERQLKNCLRLVVEEMGININASKPMEFVEEIAEKGCITQSARLKAYRVLNKLDELGTPPSRDPRGFAAAALYIGCKASESEVDKLQTQRDLATYAGLTEVTVRGRIGDIRKILIIKMPNGAEEVCSQAAR
jgi:transcription initiation factor TFIIB